ncbi:hypothetical protein EU244_028790 [Rhodococcus qingshengii]|nr:hypothetical protein [Rhodococcus qingshengii]
MEDPRAPRSVPEGRLAIVAAETIAQLPSTHTDCPAAPEPLVVV